MSPDGSRPTDVAAEQRTGPWPYIGVGCLTAPIGFFGGGMIAVLIAKMVGAAQGCTAPEGLPACNTFEYLYPGGLIGLIGLPGLALYRLRKGRKAASGVQSNQ